MYVGRVTSRRLGRGRATDHGPLSGSQVPFAAVGYKHLPSREKVRVSGHRPQHNPTRVISQRALPSVSTFCPAARSSALGKWTYFFTSSTSAGVKASGALVA